MKCIMNNTTQEIKRMTNEVATSLVSAGKYSFVPKSKWKETRKTVAVVAVAEVLTPEQTQTREQRLARRAEKLKQSRDKKNAHKRK